MTFLLLTYIIKNIFMTQQPDLDHTKLDTHTHIHTHTHTHTRYNSSEE
jgi:hypothetical protein